MVTLESERLILRDYRDSDLPSYHRLLTDKKNMYWLVELGWFMLPEHQNHGYMTEAVKRVLEFAINRDEYTERYAQRS